MKNTVKGVVLNRISYSESSFIITCYTDVFGVQKYIFQGAKKKKAPIYPLQIGEITFYKRPDSELGKMTQLSSTMAQQNLLIDPIKSSIAFFIAEVLFKCLKSEQADLSLFQFIEEIIHILEDSKQETYIPLVFLIRLTTHLGVQPMESTAELAYFNLTDGRFDEVKNVGDIYASLEVSQLIRSIYKAELNETVTNERKKAFDVMLNYYKMHIPQFGELTSLAIIKELLD